MALTTFITLTWLLSGNVFALSNPSSSLTKALSFTSNEDDRDLTLSKVLHKEVNNRHGMNEVIDLTWCLRLSLNSLHHQSIFTGSNIGHNIIKVPLHDGKQ